MSYKKLADFKGAPNVKRLGYIDKIKPQLPGFQASLLKLLPKVILTILNGMLSEAEVNGKVCKMFYLLTTGIRYFC